MAFLNFSGSFYFRHKLYIKNFHHQPHPDFQVFLKGGLFLGAAHRPLPVQTFTLFPSVNPQLLRVLAIPAFFNFVSEWQSGVSFKFHTDIGHNYAPEIKKGRNGEYTKELWIVTSCIPLYPTALFHSFFNSTRCFPCVVFRAKQLQRDHSQTANKNTLLRWLYYILVNIGR